MKIVVMCTFKGILLNKSKFLMTPLFSGISSTFFLRDMSLYPELLSSIIP
jgi:hypothetical protein